MDVSMFDYDLPSELIAQKPIDDRTASRLMVVDKKSGELEHATFRDLPSYLQKGDLLILNNSRVRNARLLGVKIETGAKIELLLLKPLGDDRWEALVKPAKRMKPGVIVQFGNGELRAIAVSPTDMAGGWIFQLEYEGDVEQLFQQLGQMPLPPYIRERLEDSERYQTVYSQEIGSAAAPTAGLHFTEELLQELEAKGVEIGYVTLHVGLGTFRPVAVEQVEEHTMHAEYYELSHEVAQMIKKAKQEGRRIVAVGTTTVRTLETIGSHSNGIRETNGWTDIFIYPGYKFQVVDAMITNFHLPKSTLLMLVSAFSTRNIMMQAYKKAVEREYRFFSFGDAMLIK
ncbi:tRNA preQ1(34) S-adenosylmethionine ribosyltransferase-isomerase QueA [Shimazuella sp. AN120528]|uniref:tRNA preQ1(34) S-adenosylmethionine ribosyltransferase-isomerase QueA n=1 Tax=Shimazuella soli TaxID=1892854 RepID=UPI001F1155B2|nr:tRNA preQ1(34) S-adenosylmethionine ribosyltransferase-isomerase QueA [Shimazuella soli]MCH5584126.1 tRNA preQ1(34) S-adenosylmethionine ribosyltransferase-isomerase QueA [Shimazuella soli]